MKELIDICNNEALVIGSRKKTLVHEFGNLHKTFHLWVHNKNSIYLQVRSNRKKLYNNLIDCSVAGHYKQHELISDGVREIEEELGVPINFRKLKFLGIRKQTFRKSNFKNREFQYIFLYHTNTNFADISYNRDEVTAFLKVKAKDIVSLFRKTQAFIESEQLCYINNRSVIKQTQLTLKDFIPSRDQYYEKIANYILNKNVFAEMPYSRLKNILDALEMDSSSLIDDFIKRTSTDTINNQFEFIFQNRFCKQRFSAAICRLSKESKLFLRYLFQTVDFSNKTLRFKIYTLGWLKNEYSLFLLKKLMRHKNPLVRFYATFVFGETCGKEKLKYIANQISDLNSRVSMVSCFSLGWNQGIDRLRLLKKYSNMSNVMQKKYIDRAIDMFN